MSRNYGELIDGWRSLLGSRLRLFSRENDGAAMVEAIIITPVILILLAGILEFGGVLVNKIELDTGMRDAARYLARCQSATYGCDPTVARNIAVYATPTPSDPPPSPRVPGWQPSDVLIDDPAPKLISNPYDEFTGLSDYRGGAQIYIVRVSTEIDYAGGPLLGLINLSTIPMAAFHEERYIGW